MAMPRRKSEDPARLTNAGSIFPIFHIICQTSLPLDSGDLPLQQLCLAALASGFGGRASQRHVRKQATLEHIPGHQVCAASSPSQAMTRLSKRNFDGMRWTCDPEVVTSSLPGSHSTWPRVVLRVVLRSVHSIVHLLASSSGSILWPFSPGPSSSQARSLCAPSASVAAMSGKTKMTATEKAKKLQLQAMELDRKADFMTVTSILRENYEVLTFAYGHCLSTFPTVFQISRF